MNRLLIGRRINQALTSMRKDGSFENDRLHWMATVHTHGNPSAYSPDAVLRKAGTWQASMREKQKQGILSQQQIQSLNDTPKWTWMNHDPFDDDLCDWIAMVQVYGGNPSAHSHNPKVRRAGQWCTRMRRAHRQGNLSKDRVRILNDIQGWTW